MDGPFNAYEVSCRTQAEEFALHNCQNNSRDSPQKFGSPVSILFLYETQRLRKGYAWCRENQEIVGCLQVRLDPDKNAREITDFRNPSII